MVWIELFSLLVKTFSTSSALWGKFKDAIRKDRTTKYVVCAVIGLFALCELTSFFNNYNKNRDVISDYEAGYTYNLQDLNSAITKLVKDYKNDTLYQSAFTSISFAAVIGVTSLILRNKKHINNRLKYILSGVILLVYICGVAIPMSFTSTKTCSFSIEQVYRRKSNPTYSVHNGVTQIIKVDYQLEVTYEAKVEISETKKFNGYKMFMLSFEMTSALAAIFILNQLSKQEMTNLSNGNEMKEESNETKV